MVHNIPGMASILSLVVLRHAIPCSFALELRGNGTPRKDTYQQGTTLSEYDGRVQTAVHTSINEYDK